MTRILREADIIDVPADALVYSTNAQLTLTGGVGASLLKRYGLRIQDALWCCAPSSGRSLADIGDVFETSLPNLPWKVIFHTVANDALYNCKPETVRSILMQVLNRCAAKGNIHSIVSSSLGTGYGDLPLETFPTIATEVTEGRDLDFIIACKDPEEFQTLVQAARKLPGEPWGIQAR